MENKKTSSYNLVAAILFVIIAVFMTGSIMRSMSVRLTISVALAVNLLFDAGLIVSAVALFQKKRDNILFVGFALLAAYAFFSFFAGFKYGWYSVYTYSRYLGSREHFNLFCVLPALANLVGYVSAFAFVTVTTTDYAPQYKEQAKKLWFVPAACIAGQIVLKIFVKIVVGGWNGYGGSYFWYSLLGAVAVLFTALWILYPDGVPMQNVTVQENGAVVMNVLPTEESGYCDLAKHILLLIFTFGIWNLIWIYRMTGYLNRVQDEPPRNPTNKLLLCMFVPFYSIYWTYKSAQRIDKLARMKGVSSDLSTLCLILAIFVGIVPPILMQDKINSVIKFKAGSASYAAPAAPAAPIAPQTAQSGSVPEELKKYKELLDSGVITQEEFDAKKKKLLDL